MSRENLDLVRSIYADWERGDFSRADWADPEIEYSWVEGPAPRTWTGLKGMAEANQDVLSAWDDVRLQATQYREIDDQCVFVQFVQHGRGKASGLDLAHIHLQAAHLFELRDGRVCRLVVYWDRERAFADLGLEEWAVSRENVGIVRGLLEAFQRRDHERAFDFYDPEIVWEDYSPASDLRGVYHGHEGVRAYWRGWLSAWRDIQFEIQDVRASGDEVVALISNQRQWGRHSAIETEVPPYGLVFTIRAGKVVRWRNFPDQAEALEAVGLAG